MSGAVEGVESEAMREAIDAGLRAFCSDTSDFTMSSAMRRAAADFIMGQPGMFTTPPARSYADEDQVYAKGRQDGYAAGRSHALDDAAKVAEDLCADMTVEANAETAGLTSTLHRASAQTAGKIAAAIRLLSQGGKA